MSIENKKCDACGCDVQDHLTLVGGIEVCDACLEALVKTTTVETISDLGDDLPKVFLFVRELVNKTVLGKEDE